MPTVIEGRASHHYNLAIVVHTKKTINISIYYKEDNPFSPMIWRRMNELIRPLHLSDDLVTSNFGSR